MIMGNSTSKRYTFPGGLPGDYPLKLVCDYKQISREEAYKELGDALENQYIHIKEQTYDEAKIELAKDLDFFSLGQNV